MSRPPSLALVASGPARHSVVARLPRLAQLIGPVKGPELRIASRIANSLRAGWAAREWEEFEEADIVLISIETPGVFTRMIAEMAAAPLPWRGKTIVSADTPAGRQALGPLASQGAETASLTSIETMPPVFVLDAGRRAGRIVRRLVRDAGGRVVEASEPAYVAAARVVEHNLAETFGQAERILTQSGLARAEARRLVEMQCQQTLRACARLGRLPRRGARWAGPVGIPAD